MQSRRRNCREIRSDNVYELMIIDGGNKDSGKAIVEHIRAEFGNDKVISHVVLTHSVMRTTRPALQKFFPNCPSKIFGCTCRGFPLPLLAPILLTSDGLMLGLALTLRAEYDLIDEIFNIAVAKKTIQIYQPFAGSTIGPFRVLSPHKSVYPLLLPQFDRTPDPDQDALEAAGWWIGKPPSAMVQLVENLLVKSLAKGPKWIQEKWSKEYA